MVSGRLEEDAVVVPPVPLFSPAVEQQVAAQTQLAQVVVVRRDGAAVGVKTVLIAIYGLGGGQHDGLTLTGRAVDCSVEFIPQKLQRFEFPRSSRSGLARRWKGARSVSRERRQLESSEAFWGNAGDRRGWESLASYEEPGAGRSWHPLSMFFPLFEAPRVRFSSQ